MTTRVIYLDNAATTAVDPRVVAAMNECLGEDGDYANPSSASHALGRSAGGRIERARADVAALVNAVPEQIVFTSGATEANNLALLGVARFNANRARHIVTSRTEHPAVLDACRQLEREGCAVTYLSPDAGGRVDPAQVAAALRPDTLLVSVMHVNNEIGVINDVGAIGRLCRERGVLLHVDAAQGAGKAPLDVQADAIDLLSFTAHKLHGPKGVGALCMRREPRLGLLPLQFGGGQERGLRSGTLPTHQIVGMGVACRIARAEMAADMARIAGLRAQLWQALSELPGILLNGDPARRVAGILNVTVDGIEGETLLFALADLALSSGSACSSLSAQPSYVLRALGRSDRLAQSSLRLSLGRFTTAADVDHAAARIRREVLRLRAGEPGPGPELGFAGVGHQRLVDRNHCAAGRHLGGADPLARLDGRARLAGLHFLAHALRRERDQLAGHRRRHGGHADLDRAVAQFLEPDVVLDVIQQFIGQVATLHVGHLGTPQADSSGAAS